ncbi:glutathione ABC transporter substrate-binding protein [Salinicoccus sp. ID82-1]|uniref:Glutathione ABC transporter substrate-binding protein n=1 Tax=Salinicoccus cyprini TaxID=2493691 RepID=A0A558ATX2_9STAP|nr:MULTISPECIES: glutathione ABC transporter substrate-binding protein [Salinicoccus]MCG1010808.1 glutathione ABC transporter substrate-binding protein [Salinicoccus sp. ID82-1]TVT27709.1 glutathione ABC transporter substrate-binding protein [Salinicoccus cyprini]
MKKVYLFLLICILALAGCTDDSNVDEQAAESGDPSMGGEDIGFSLQALPSSLDPHAANDGYSLYVMINIYETLVRMNQDLELEPGLAESYEQVDDTTWEFKLREDVTFHDGSPFNAEVVKANLDRVRDPEVGSPLEFLFTEIEEVEVVDDYTVNIHTARPFAALPAHLAHPGGSMISKEVIDQDYENMENGGQPLTEVNANPVGTGFFEFEEIAEGDHITLIRNEDYWGEPASPASVTFKAVPEDGTRIAELSTGDADLIYPVNPSDVERIDSTDGARAEQHESASMSYLGFNLEKEPFDDPNVRRAIAMAIDKEAIINEMLEGIPAVAETPLNPTVKGYSEDLEPIDHDMEAARSLLEESGYADGFTAEIIVRDRTTSDIATYIQQALQELNITLEIRQMESGAYQEYTANGQHDMFMGSWGTVTLDADYGLYPMFHSDNHGAPGNRTFYSNEEVDTLLDEARTETDEAARMQMYEDAQQIIIDEAPLVPIYHSVLLAGINDELEGYFQYPSSFPYLKDLQ